MLFNPRLRHEPRDRQWAALMNMPNLHENLKRRFVLSAEPQIGKTGAYLHFIELLCQRGGWKLAVNNTAEFHRLLEKLKKMPPAELHIALKTDQHVRDDWDRFHILQDQRFEKLPRGLPEGEHVPLLRALQFIRQVLKNNANQVRSTMLIVQSESASHRGG